jgi:N-acetylmuramoyl-L-alanine amidase CwlA
MNVVQNLIKMNKYTRTGIKLKEVKAIVLHWTGNPNSSALANRNYFDTLSGTYASAHYIVGIKGEVIQCIPDDELAYHVGAKVYTDLANTKLNGRPNYNTIGIEMCIPYINGEFTKETLNSTKELVISLIKKFNLGPDDIITHHDVTGKDCPKWFVDNPREFLLFKEEVKKAMVEQWKKEAVQKCFDLGLLKSNEWINLANEKASIFFVCSLVLNLYEKLKK